MQPKIIQICQSSAGTGPYPVHVITALCDDGSVWVYRQLDGKALNQGAWQQLPMLPVKGSSL